MNKNEALSKIKILEDELSKLKDIVNKPKDLFDIVTYNEVCEQLGKDLQKCPYKKIKQLERLFNNDWKPNWSNFTEYKYYPYFEYKLGGWVFVGSGRCRFSFSGQVGFYKNQKISDHIGKYFKSIYEELLIQ